MAFQGTCDFLAFNEFVRSAGNKLDTLSYRFLTADSNRMEGTEESQVGTRQEMMDLRSSWYR